MRRGSRSSTARAGFGIAKRSRWRPLFTAADWISNHDFPDPHPLQTRKSLFCFEDGRRKHDECAALRITSRVIHHALCGVATAMLPQAVYPRYLWRPDPLSLYL